MIFSVINRREVFVPQDAQWPQAVLVRDAWDDFHFQTTFALTIHNGPGQTSHIGTVKILELGMTSGPTALPTSFESLPATFISLGQEFSYYEALRRLPTPVYEALFHALNDVVFRPELRQRFESEPGFETSLLRFSSAQAALETAPGLFSEEPPHVLAGPLRFQAQTNVGGHDFMIDFEFLTTPALPGHLAAVIGYNGTGKTRLLANLAFVVAETGLSSEAGSSHGEMLESTLHAFAGVIAVSYSAFDTFEIPSARPPQQSQPPDPAPSQPMESASDRVERTGSFHGYTYVGLRKTQGDATGPTSLKNSDELADDFRRSLERALERDRISGLRDTLTALLAEPSFSRSGLNDHSFDNAEDAARLFEQLSTGHKVVLTIVVNLVAQLQPRTLVLIDEPETHLHPPLVAALLSAISTALGRYESVAIVATHSPVVIQEVPGRQVRVLRRFGAFTTVERLEVESYAEDVGYLTRNVFNLDSSVTDYQAIMQKLAEQYSESEIEAMFEHGLSRQGRALIASFRPRADG